MDNYKIVEKILDGSSQRLRESYFKKHHIDILKNIMGFTDNLELTFKQRVWHWVNNEPNYIICKCGNRTTFNKNWRDGYKKHCSSKCAQLNQDTKEKRKKTNLERYGVDNVAKNGQVKKKQESTNLERYGTKSSFQNKKVREKWENNIMSKYGVNHIFKTEEFKLKALKTNIEKYGVNYYVQSEDYKKRLIDMSFDQLLRNKHLEKHKIKYEKIGFKFLKIENRILTLKNTKTCKHEFDISYDVFMSRSNNNYEICTICNNIKSGQSNKEKETIKWLKSLNVDVIERYKAIGKEIDIFLPDYKIGIEFNGLYWHSHLYKEKNYHINKTLISEENGIDLIHLWEDDWDYKQDIIKSIISNRLNLIVNKIYARKCIIKEVNKKDSSVFLNNNHIQGNTRSKYNIGLYYNDELVSLMCFNYRNNSNKNDLELVRFCNEINTTVVGGSSKLFSYFIKNNDINKIISFSDISIFNGGLYEKLNFYKTSTTPPNFWWVIDKQRVHRFKYNKSKLVKDGYNPSKTETEIMVDRGFYKIWGCGMKKWEWERET